MTIKDLLKTTSLAKEIVANSPMAKLQKSMKQNPVHPGEDLQKLMEQSPIHLWVTEMKEQDERLKQAFKPIKLDCLTKQFDKLREAVKNSCSFASVIKELGYKQGGSTQERIKTAVDQLGLDTSHFLGQASNQGERHKGNKRSWEEVLVENRKETPWVLRRSLLEQGRSYECEGCEQGDEWHGRELRLQVDHINGEKTDNRPENLRFLCPNCHSVTETWGKNKGFTDLTTNKRYWKHRRQQE